VCAKVKPVAFHRHFNAISPFCLLPFDDAPKSAVKQKASGTWKVQSAGCTEFGVRGPECRIQSEICDKKAPFKGIRQSVGNRLLVCPVACSLTVFSGPTCHLEPRTQSQEGVQFFMPSGWNGDPCISCQQTSIQRVRLGLRSFVAIFTWMAG